MNLKIAIFGDTHIRPNYDDQQFEFKSDYLHTSQAEKAVNEIVAQKPDFVIHLGDVVHPIPTLESHKNALDVAKKMFSKFDIPLYVVPGNHDIGDKKNTSNAPKVDGNSKSVFEQYWNKTYLSFDKSNLHFIILDSILLCFDDEKAKAQKNWLLKDLEANKNKRTFLFLHFPPFLLDKNETEHYDNLPKQSRNWLLEIIEKYNLEAVFSGHVHRFFYNKIKQTKFYTLPATSFVRPEYSNLNNVKPSDFENGRDDKEQLGISFLTINEKSHLLNIHRIFSKYPKHFKNKKNIGVWLRKKLSSITEIPFSDLDLLTRKYARNDAILFQIINLGIKHLRIPLQDLEDEAVKERLTFLKNYDIQFTFFCNGFPKKEQEKLLENQQDYKLEIIVKTTDLQQIKNNYHFFTSDKNYLSTIGKFTDKNKNYHSHFPRVGFNPLDKNVETIIENSSQKIKRFVFRLNADQNYEAQIKPILLILNKHKIEIICYIELPFKSESEMQTDDELIAKKCKEALEISAKYKHIIFFLDQFFDKDRGYWCRNGLLTNSDLPRFAYNVIKQF